MKIENESTLPLRKMNATYTVVVSKTLRGVTKLSLRESDFNTEIVLVAFFGVLFMASAVKFRSFHPMF
jgi:hypothetical protein